FVGLCEARGFKDCRVVGWVFNESWNWEEYLCGNRVCECRGLACKMGSRSSGSVIRSLGGEEGIQILVVEKKGVKALGWPHSPMSVRYSTWGIINTPSSFNANQLVLPAFTHTYYTASRYHILTLTPELGLGIKAMARLKCVVLCSCLLKAVEHVWKAHLYLVRA
ncbi:hypothetical protein Tco_0216784, partial [Tanacetum coccineum]